MISITMLKSTVAAALLLGGSVVASAQDAAPQPGQSTETFQDWSVECTSVKTAAAEEDAAEKGDKPTEAMADSRRVCEAVQVYRNNKTGQEIARLAFAYGIDGTGKAGILLGGLRAIVDVSFANPPKVMSGEAVLYDGVFQRCAGQFCYASFALPADGAKGLESAADPALQFPISSGQMISIKVSPNGLTDALKVLVARAK